MDDVHIFRPDHNLYCLDCGEGELMGNHGINAIDKGERLYASPEIAEMYADQDPAFENDVDDTFGCGAYVN